MNIQNISKTDKKVVVELNSDDLINICNALYAVFDKEKGRSRFLQLYSDLMMARDLCQYGHLDDFSLQSIVKCRNSSEQGLDGVLSDDDIDTFNSYLENNDIPVAFGNSDWCAVYKKIVGDHGKFRAGEKIKNWMAREEQNND